MRKPKPHSSKATLDMPLEFVKSADVELGIGGNGLPAHSQFLPSQSRFMAKMFEDLDVSFSRSDKFTVSRRSFLVLLSTVLCAF